MAKTPNWTVEQSTALIADWQASNKDPAAITALANQAKRSERAIIMKLVREGQYSSPAKKSAVEVVSKEELAEKIGAFLPDGTSPEAISTLSKAGKTILRILAKQLADLSEFRRMASESFEQEQEEAGEYLHGVEIDEGDDMEPEAA